MSRYIDADKAIEILTQLRWHDADGYLIDDYDEKRQCAEDWISQVPTADVEEVRHGEWIPIILNYHSCETDIVSTRIAGYQCSLCGAEEKFKYKYCHCGAKMYKENEE